MRKNLTITFFFAISIILSFSQSAQPSRIRLTGEIKDEKQKAVSYAHIIEESRNEGWVSDYYGNFRAEVLPGDTLIISAVSFHHATILVPVDLKENECRIEVVMKQDTVQLRELVIYPWPSTFSQLKRDFLQVEVEDPLADLDLHLPSPEELKMLSYSLEGGFGIKVPLISILYDQFSKEAKNKKNYETEMKREKAYTRYNKVVVSRVTGLKNEDEIQKFMAYCALQVKFILESTDYELYAAILNCYHDFCQAGLLENTGSK
jgi:hypothetical protein